jgi:hypothetical protein
VCANGGIAAVGKRAGLTVAETGDIVFISAEVLLFGGSVVVRFGVGGEGEECT